MFDIPVSTLRYYDKEGLFPGMHRDSGIRKFSEQEIDALRVIDCLKKTGLEIKDIKRFMGWCVEGSSTYPERLALFRRQKQCVEEEMERLQQVQAMLRFKCWYYEQALQDGSEERLRHMKPEEMPEDIRKAYAQSHPALGE